MNDLRKAAEMALKQLQRDDVYLGHRSKTRADAITALRQALDLQTAIERGTKAWADVPDATEWVDNLRGNTPDCKTHPDAPHGFDRNASHSADRYVCECEEWEPVDNAYTKLDTTLGVLHKEWVGLSEDEFEKILETHNEAMPFAIYLSIEARLKEKNA